MKTVDEIAIRLEPFARAIEAEVRKEQASKIAELTDALQFVERWAVHHGSKSSTSAESALGVIQHYPPIAAITASYADGKTPDTFNPFAKITELERQLAEARQSVREAVPEGFVVVPLNPTKLMKEVGGAACTLGLDIAHYTYSRMIAAAKEAK